MIIQPVSSLKQMATVLVHKVKNMHKTGQDWCLTFFKSGKRIPTLISMKYYLKKHFHTC